MEQAYIGSGDQEETGLLFIFSEFLDYSGEYLFTDLFKL